VFPSPASVDLSLGASLVRIRTAGAPPGFLHAPRLSPRRRRCSPLAHGVAHRLEELRSKRDRRLTSFVASRARITGSSRLTAAFRRATSRCSPGDLPARPGPPTRRPVKDDVSSNQDARDRIEKPHGAFARKVQPCASSVRIQRAARAPVRLRSTVARVSRGVSAVGATISFGLGPTRRSRLAAFSWSEIRDASDRVSASHNSNNEHPYPGSFPVQRHRLFVGRGLDGLPPVEPGMRAFHDAPHRFGGSRWLRGGVFFLPTRQTIVPLTPLSRPSLDTGARVHRGARKITDSAKAAKTASTPPS
jgi:hypothetical protein